VADIKDMTDELKRKFEEGVLPPDPARVVAEILEIGPEVEEATPLPPVIRKIHSEIVIPFVERLPRLPMTRKFGKF